MPFILLSNKELASAVKYQIKYNSGDIMLSNPTVRLTVIPEPKSVDLRFAGKVYKMDRIGTSWTSLLHNVSEGMHTIEVKPEGAESTEIKIRIVGVSGDSDIENMFDL